MSKTAELKLPQSSVELPVVVGTENEQAVDITRLRAETGYITLDSGYGNTGACTSEICFIDGEKGVLRYRGYPIEQLAERSTFVEVAYLLIWGQLPTAAQLERFETMLTARRALAESVRGIVSGELAQGPPMALLSAMINASCCCHPELLEIDGEDHFEEAAAHLIAKAPAMAATIYQRARGSRPQAPDPALDYTGDFLHQMFSGPGGRYEADEDVVRAMNLILILHADHEQNCSTSTVRMVGSSRANLFASVAAGVGALWGPLHGGANVAVMQMLEGIRSAGISPHDYMDRVKDRTSASRLMGFGHRVYKNFDPRAKVLKNSADRVLAKLGVDDPLLEIAKELEAEALKDDYFVQRKLYPNVDFYSGIIMRAIGIPTDLFTVMFALGRLPGWIAHWYEGHRDPKSRINRPRQIYQGPRLRDYVPLERRG